MMLRGPGGAVVAGTTAYDAGTRTATLTPTRDLAHSTSYTVHGQRREGRGGQHDGRRSRWTFTTAAPPPPRTGGRAGRADRGRHERRRTRPRPTSRRSSAPRASTSSPTCDVADLTADDAGGVRRRHAGRRRAHRRPGRPTSPRWVNAGGNLVAMRPDAARRAARHHARGGHASRRLPRVNAADRGRRRASPTETMQFHGTADRYTLSGATRGRHAVLRRHDRHGQPAVTLRSVGTNGGQAAAFTYDLARSVVHTRQGNPAWAGQERDGADARSAPTTCSSAAPRTDWVNLAKVADPAGRRAAAAAGQPDRSMNRDRMPLPRFWYFPHSLKAVVVATGDDHANGGTAGPLRRSTRANSPAGLLGRRLGVPALHVVRLPEHAAHQRPGGGIPRPRASRSGCTRRTAAPTTRARRASRRRTPTSSPPGEPKYRACPRPTPTAPLHRLERLGQPAEGRARQRHPAGHQLLLLARALGRTTGPAS